MRWSLKDHNRFDPFPDCLVSLDIFGILAKSKKNKKEIFLVRGAPIFFNLNMAKRQIARGVS